MVSSMSIQNESENMTDYDAYSGQLTVRSVVVTRLNNSGNGFSARGVKHVKDKQFKTNFAVWPDQDAGVQPGDIIDIRGDFSVKIVDGEGNNGPYSFAQVSINEPQIKKVGHDPDWDQRRNQNRGQQNSDPGAYRGGQQQGNQRQDEPWGQPAGNGGGNGWATPGQSQSSGYEAPPF